MSELPLKAEQQQPTNLVWRHEQKFWISLYQYHRLRSAFRSVLYIDKYCYEQGDYNIRSLYFDSYQGEAAFDKLSGLSTRRKFISASTTVLPTELSMENRFKIDFQTEFFTEFGTTFGVDRRDAWPVITDDNVLMQFYHEMNQNLIKPAVLVEYDREAYVHPMGNVRITFDKTYVLVALE